MLSIVLLAPSYKLDCPFPIVSLSPRWFVSVGTKCPLWEIWELVLELPRTLLWHRAALVLVSNFSEDQVLCLGWIAGRVPMSWLARTRDVPVAKNPSTGTAQQRLFLVLKVVLHAVVVISEVLRLSTKSRCSRCCRHISSEDPPIIIRLDVN